MNILRIKDWLKKKEHQFFYVDVPDFAIRLKDNAIFSKNSSYLFRINGLDSNEIQSGSITGFADDNINVYMWFKNDKVDEPYHFLTKTEINNLLSLQETLKKNIKK